MGAGYSGCPSTRIPCATSSGRGAGSICIGDQQCIPDCIYETRRKLDKVVNAANIDLYHIRVHSGTSSLRCAAHTHKSVALGWHAKIFKAVNFNFDQHLM
jgi:hypothetical protein